MDPKTISEDEWVRGEYQASDVVVFHGLTPHTGMVTCTDILRLSIDIRAEPASVPAPVLGTVVAVNGDDVDVKSEDGTVTSVGVDEATVVRSEMPRAVPLEEFIGHWVIAGREGERTLLLRWAS